MQKAANKNLAASAGGSKRPAAPAAAFARGMRQFNAREFWHAHESWEAIWLRASQQEKTFLQGLIQISAAFYHHRRGNRIGTRSLLRRGLEKVEKFHQNHRGLCLEELRRAVREWPAGLDLGETLAGKRYPRLRWSARECHSPPRAGPRSASTPRGKHKVKKKR